MYNIGNSNTIIETRISTSSCKKLWAAVLLAQWDLVFKSSKKKSHFALRFPTGDVMAARRWFGGRNFSIVCDLAGVDPEYVLDRFEEKLRAHGGMA
ncbi:MAG: hypothetical protein COA84_15215 [Robiginitomaculum sp.]|nr:MAG: hypothetical protein COA84_15215 [Robiginitomaculum sp.]